MNPYYQSRTSVMSISNRSAPNRQCCSIAATYNLFFSTSTAFYNPMSVAPHWLSDFLFCYGIPSTPVSVRLPIFCPRCINVRTSPSRVADRHRFRFDLEGDSYPKSQLILCKTFLISDLNLRYSFFNTANLTSWSLSPSMEKPLNLFPNYRITFIRATICCIS